MIPIEAQSIKRPMPQKAHVPAPPSDAVKFSIAWQNTNEEPIEPRDLKTSDAAPEEELLLIEEQEQRAVPGIPERADAVSTENSPMTALTGKSFEAIPLGAEPTRVANPDVKVESKLVRAETSVSKAGVSDQPVLKVGSKDLELSTPQKPTPEPPAGKSNPPSAVTAAMINLAGPGAREGRLSIEVPPGHKPTSETARHQHSDVSQAKPPLTIPEVKPTLSPSDRQRQNSDPTNDVKRVTMARDAVTASPLPAPVAAQASTPPFTLAIALQQMAIADLDKHAVEGPEIATGGAANSTSGTKSTPGHPMQHNAPNVAQQVATALVQSKGGKTEIVLNPEELGKVRIALQAAEKGMSVSIISERPETAELMRRNVEILEREFRDLGYESVSFSFDDPPDGSGDGSEHPNTADQSADRQLIETPSPELGTNVAVLTGLDLKL